MAVRLAASVTIRLLVNNINLSRRAIHIKFYNNCKFLDKKINKLTTKLHYDGMYLLTNKDLHIPYYSNGPVYRTHALAYKHRYSM